MPEPTDMIIPLLQDLRARMVALDEKIDRNQAEARASFATLEARHKAIRNALGTDSLMSKFLLGDFEERLAMVEQRLELLAAKPT